MATYGLLQQRFEHLQFALSSYKSGEPMLSGNVEPGTPGLPAGDLKYLHRSMALELRCAQRQEGEIPLRQAVRRLTHENGAWLRQCLQRAARLVVSPWAV